MQSRCVACADEIGQTSWRGGASRLKNALSVRVAHTLQFDPGVNSCYGTSLSVWMRASACVGLAAHLSPVLAASFEELHPGDFPPCCRRPGCLSWFSKIHFTSSAKLAGPHLSRAANIWYAKLRRGLYWNLKWSICSPPSAEPSANCFGVFAPHLAEIVCQSKSQTSFDFIFISLHGDSGDEVQFPFW